MKPLDLSKTIDLLKIRFYLEWMLNQHLYAEGESEFHSTLTKQVVETYIDPLNLPKDAVILDLGCGPGYFLNAMKEREYTNLVGVTLSPEDIELCESKGHVVKQYDLSFLPQSDGYHDESVDFIFLRHALEHSPFPILSLIEYNRVLKQGGKIYIEVPAPDCDRMHEYNPNHYSILGNNQLSALLARTGFEVDRFDNLEFELNVPSSESETGTKKVKEKYYCIVAQKRYPLDIK